MQNSTNLWICELSGNVEWCRGQSEHDSRDFGGGRHLRNELCLCVTQRDVAGIQLFFSLEQRTRKEREGDTQKQGRWSVFQSGGGGAQVLYEYEHVF